MTSIFHLRARSYDEIYARVQGLLWNTSLTWLPQSAAISNYTYYKWQKSTDGGSSWFDTGVSGVGSPTLVSGQWEYTAVYPQFVAWQPDSGHRYRTVVATTPANLNNPNCSYSNNANTFLNNIIDCGIILNVNLKEFKGEIIRDNTELNWTLVAGNNIDHFELEKSYDGVNFRKLSDVPYYYKNGESVYSYPDPERPAGISFYRLKILTGTGTSSTARWCR